jgi:predicted Rossmann fold flavoprotein
MSYVRKEIAPEEIARQEEICRRMQGLSLRNTGLSLYRGDKLLYRDQGEMLFTHFGVSGPLVLSASGHIRDISKPHTIHIDLKPSLDAKKLDLRIQRDFEEYKNREIINSLSKLLPAKLIPVIVRLSGIPADKRVNSVTREERLRLGALIKNVTLDIAAFRPIDEAIITSGGVSVKEIDPKTMESKLVKGLYFAGEIIDTDAYTGGFNLQIAWSTAYAAASAMSIS